MTTTLELLAPDLGQLFNPANGRLRACLHRAAAEGEQLSAEPQRAEPSETALLTIQSDAPGLLTVDLSDNGQQWRRAAWFAFKAGAPSSLRFQPGAPWWRPSVTTDRDTALVSVFAQSRIFLT